MNELIASILKGFKERVKSTLWLNFCFAWIIFNWKFFVILFFEPDLTFRYVSKLDYITQKVSQFSKIEPIIYAFLFTLGMPILNLGVLAWQRLIVRLKDWVIIKIEKIKGPVDAERYVRALNIIEIEKRKNIKSKAQFENINAENMKNKRLYEESTSSFEKNIAQPLREKIDSHKNQIINLNNDKSELLSKFQPFTNILNLTAYSWNGGFDKQNHNHLIFNYNESPPNLASEFEKSQMNSSKSFFTFTNEYVKVNQVELKVLSTTKSYIEETNIVQIVITTKHAKVANKLTTFKVVYTSKHIIILAFDYFNLNESPVSFIALN
jgi:hypothetical protein